MLNTCLTVRAHEAASHKDKGWESFTQKVIHTVTKVRTRGVVFLAWGSPAQKRCKGLEAGGKHLVLQSVHPSPLSAHKGFMTCGHFKTANEWLARRYGEEGVINWNLDKAKPIAAPMVGGPVKAAVGQEKHGEEARPTTVMVEEMQGAGTTALVLSGSRNSGVTDDDDDDADAIEALEEIANAEAEAGKGGKGEGETET